MARLTGRFGWCATGAFVALAAYACAADSDTGALGHRPTSECTAVDRLLDGTARQRAFPGGVLVVGRRDSPAHVHAFGRLTYETTSPAVTDSTIYDLASVTKVVATTAVAMVLVDQHRLGLDAAVSTYLPDFGDAGKDQVRVRDLLTHSSGLPAWAPLYREVRGRDAVLARICAMEPEYEPGTRSLYSDLGMIALGAILERVAGEPLDVAAQRLVFEPLGMRDTRFTPPREVLERVAPTEQDAWRGRLLRGEVHDENAYVMGGVAGHAGLFSTAPDVARLAQMLLRGGELDGRRLVSEATVRLFTTRCGIPGSSRALGWDMLGSDPFLGVAWSQQSYGHTGLTGTFLWIDPEKDVFVVLLTNRVYPTRENDSFRALRRQVSDLVLSIVGSPSGRR